MSLRFRTPSRRAEVWEHVCSALFCSSRLQRHRPQPRTWHPNLLLHHSWCLAVPTADSPQQEIRSGISSCKPQDRMALTSRQSPAEPTGRTLIGTVPAPALRCHLARTASVPLKPSAPMIQPNSAQSGSALSRVFQQVAAISGFTSIPVPTAMPTAAHWAAWV